jgi:uncharacterized protein (DUF1778 family)
VKDYDDIAREYDAMKEAGTELDNLAPVEARVASNVRAVFSLRLSPEELGQISRAAKKRGMSVSDFLRQAGLAAAQNALDIDAGEQAIVLQKVKEQVRLLSETVEKAV